MCVNTPYREKRSNVAKCWHISFFKYKNKKATILSCCCHMLNCHKAGSASSRTETLNIQPQLQWNGLDQSIFMCYNDPVQVQT
ncbi:hypothetical protein EXN66_Car000182 [Channa argus]|uniref:Uncharacterized protein n=1 Tax=Channa argus TaxID=215402 RepID=A0A6G1QWE3_CHAAH|nr:hypothetical protein EXN66_Car000182 [Channa argus]